MMFASVLVMTSALSTRLWRFEGEWSEDESILQWFQEAPEEFTEPTVKSCGRGLQWVNHIYDNQGKTTCECYPIGDQCLKDEQCEKYPECANLEPSDDVIFYGTYYNEVLSLDAPDA